MSAILRLVALGLVALIPVINGARIKSRQGGQVTREQSKPGYKGWAQGKQFICFNKWKKRGQKGTGDYCLVDLKEIFEARSNIKSNLYHMYVSARWSDCQAKTRKYAMKLCTLKGKRDVRVSYSKRIHVPKACLAMSGKFVVPRSTKSITIFQAMRSGRECNAIFTNRLSGRGKFAKLPTPSPLAAPRTPAPSSPSQDVDDAAKDADEPIRVKQTLTDFSAKLMDIVVRLKDAKAMAEDDGGAVAAEDLHDAAKIGQEIVEAFETNSEFAEDAQDIGRINVGLEVMAKIADMNGEVDFEELDEIIEVLSDAAEEAIEILSRLEQPSETENDPLTSLHDAAKVGQEVAAALEKLPQSADDAETVKEITTIVQDMAKSGIVDKETVDAAIIAIEATIDNLPKDLNDLAPKLADMLSKLEAAKDDEHWGFGDEEDEQDQLDDVIDNAAMIALSDAAASGEEVAEALENDSEYVEDAEEVREIIKVVKDLAIGGKVASEKLDEAIALANSKIDKLKEENSELAAKLAEVLSFLESMKTADQDFSAAAVVVDLKNAAKAGEEVAEALEKDPEHVEDADTVREIVKVVVDMANDGKVDTRKMEEAIQATKDEIEKLKGDMDDLAAKLAEMLATLEGVKRVDKTPPADGHLVPNPNLQNPTVELEKAAKAGEELVEALETDASSSAVDGEKVKEIIKIVEVMVNDGADVAKLEAVIANAATENDKLKEENGVLSAKLAELLAQLEAAKEKVDAGFTWMHDGGKEIAEGWEDELKKVSEAADEGVPDEELSTEFGNKVVPEEAEEDEEVDFEELDPMPEVPGRYSNLHRGDMTWDNVWAFWKEREARAIAIRKEEARVNEWRERARARAQKAAMARR